MAELAEDLLAFDLSDSEPEAAGETAREARIREAVEASKTYVAHRELPYWFQGQSVDQMRSLRRAGPEVEWTIASKYALGEYQRAYSLARSALRIQNLIQSVPVGTGSSEVLRAPVDKHSMPRLASKVNTREALDTALRSACRMVRDGAYPPEEDCIALLLLAKDEAMGWFPSQEWDRALPVDIFPSPTRQNHWSAHPGLIASAGDLSLALGRHVEAAGMYALSLAARPEQWRVWMMLLRSLLLLEMRGFARAAACATCFYAPPAARAQLASTLLGRLRDTGGLDPVSASTFPSTQPGLSAQSEPEPERSLPYPIWYVLVHGAFFGRVREGESESTEANFRSVRSL